MGDGGESDLSTLLLAHIREVFDGTDKTGDGGEAEDDPPMPTDELESAALVTRLCAREDWPWDELGKGRSLTAPGLAKRLRDFGVRPKQFRTGKQKRRGYMRGQFHEAWRRFLPDEKTVPHNPPETPGTPGTPGTPQVNRAPVGSSVPGALGTTGTGEVAPTPPVPGTDSPSGTSPTRAVPLATGTRSPTGTKKMSPTRAVPVVPVVPGKTGGSIAESVSRDGEPAVHPLDPAEQWYGDDPDEIGVEQ
jgi:hypothetical protein